MNLIAPVRGRIALVDYTCWKNEGSGGIRNASGSCFFERRKKMKRGINPIAVIVMIIAAVAAIAAALLVRNALPPEASQYKGLVFWGIIIGIGGGGALLAGRHLNKRR